MSTIHGGQGNIVTNGLILNIDAANPRSYPPPYNSNTWLDLSGGNRNGTLLNGPTFDTSGSGCIVLDGTNDNISHSSSINWALSSSSTVSVWSNSTNGTGYIVNFDKGSWLGWYFTTTVFLYCGQAGLDQTTSFGSAPNGIWYYLTAVVDRENLLFRTYRNGLFVAQTTIIQPPLNYSSNLFFGSRGVVQDNFFNGKVANAQVYNRALSNSEVLQNYTATRARFGV